MKALSNQPNAQDEEEDEEEVYLQQLEAFANLDHTTYEFLSRNLKERHVLVSPITQASIFNPRYKKLTLFVTEVFLLMVTITICITYDGKIVVSFDPNVPSVGVERLIGFSVLAGLFSSAFCYLLAAMMRTSVEQRKKIYNIVKSGKEMLILKEW